MLRSLFKTKKDQPNISVMLMEVAEDFFNTPQNFVDRQFHLELAAAAWSIACEDNTTARSALLGEFLDKFKGDYTKQEVKNLKKEMLSLIEKKILLHPSEKFIIVEARLEPDGERERVIISSFLYNR